MNPATTAENKDNEEAVTLTNEQSVFVAQ